MISGCCRKVWSTVGAVDTVVSISALMVLVVIVAVQVFCRYVLQNSLDWTEELARYLSIWAVLFGCSYAMKDDAHLEMTILRGLVSPRAAKRIHAFACFMCLFFCLIMLYAGMESIFNIRWSEQTTPAMQLPAWIIWLAMPIGFGLMAIHALLRMVQILSGNPDNLVSTSSVERAAASL